MYLLCTCMFFFLITQLYPTSIAAKRLCNTTQKHIVLTIFFEVHAYIMQPNVLLVLQIIIQLNSPFILLSVLRKQTPKKLKGGRRHSIELIIKNDMYLVCLIQANTTEKTCGLQKRFVYRCKPFLSLVMN